MKRKAFTLIEMLIVLTVVAILVPTTFSIVFVILRQQVRIYRVVETRRQGDYIQSFIKDKLIRSTVMTNLNPYNTVRCQTAGPSYTDADGDNTSFLDTNAERYRIYLDGTDLKYNNETDILTTILNSSNVKVENFVISCVRRGDYSSPLVGISYDVEFIDNTPTIEEGTVRLHYQTKIKLR